MAGSPDAEAGPWGAAAGVVQVEWGRLAAPGAPRPAPGTEARPLFSRRGANPPAAHGEDPFMREGKNLLWKVKGEQFNL